MKKEKVVCPACGNEYRECDVCDDKGWIMWKKPVPKAYKLWKK